MQRNRFRDAIVAGQEGTNELTLFACATWVNYYPEPSIAAPTARLS